MIHHKNEFDPDYLVSPGEILEETLEAKNMKKINFAKRCGRSAKTISQIISGEAPITPELAIRFQRVLGSSSTLWNNLEANYRLQLAKIQEDEALKKETNWAKGFPIKDLINRGVIKEPKNDIDKVAKLLKFFGVGSVQSWENNYAEELVNYRHSPSFKSDKKALAAWLRIGELKANSIDCEEYDKNKFKKALLKIRYLTDKNPEIFEPKIKELCRKAGVVIILEPELPKTHLSGATCWIHKDKALIMLSLRHKSDDHLWFTFFHEAAHILLHGKKMIFIDCINGNSDNKKLEYEANKFAEDILIPQNEYKNFIKKNEFDKESILRFAKIMNISPGIVIGRLQKNKKIPYSWHNKLKKKIIFKNN